MPASITTPAKAKTYATWAKGQGLCLPCLDLRQAAEAYTLGQQRGFVGLTGSFKQVQWALKIRLAKLHEIDLAQRSLTAHDTDRDRRDDLVNAYIQLGNQENAATWISVRNMTMDALVDQCLASAE